MIMNIRWEVIKKKKKLLRKNKKEYDIFTRSHMNRRALGHIKLAMDARWYFTF